MHAHTLFWRCDSLAVDDVLQGVWVFVCWGVEFEGGLDVLVRNIWASF